MGDAVLTLAGLVAGVAAGAFLVLTVVGVVLLSRRSRRRAAAPAARTAAGSELLRADEALRDAQDDLAYAVAQFGQERARPLAAAVERARGELRRAFELQQRLDDRATADERRRREWTRETAAIATRVRGELEAERRRFVELRGDEAGAGAELERLRGGLAATREALGAAARVLVELEAAYSPALLAAVSDAPERAATELDAAESRLDAAAAAIAAAPVTSVAEELRAIGQRLARAAGLVAAIGRRRDELAAADASLAALRREADAEAEAARALRDAPPDPERGAAVGAAIAELEARLAATRPRTDARRDPVAALDELVEASDALDAAVADARNQQRRLDGARGALDGALVSARTQIAAVRDYIGGHRGGAGVDARTRLAEAERELLLAENEADPVAALDAARRAQTHARDADALARYRG